MLRAPASSGMSFAGFTTGNSKQTAAKVSWPAENSFLSSPRERVYPSRASDHENEQSGCRVAATKILPYPILPGSRSFPRRAGHRRSSRRPMVDAYGARPGRRPRRLSLPADANRALCPLDRLPIFEPSADVEDVVQDVLMTVHAVRHTYDPKRPFGPWLVAIAHGRIIDQLRRQTRRKVSRDEFRPSMKPLPPLRRTCSVDVG